MSNLTISLGEVQDLVMVKASFEKDQSITLNFGAQMETGTGEVTINPSAPWHPDLREAVKALDMHCARLSGQLGHLAEQDPSKWPSEAIEWWEGVRVRMRILSITWSGQNRTKIKMVGEAYLKDGHTLMQAPLVDLERSKYEYLGDFERLVDTIREELVLYIGGKTAIGRQTTIFDDMVVEPVKEGIETFTELTKPSGPILGLPEASVPVTAEAFRKGVAAALKGQGAKLGKAKLAMVSEHMRTWCVCNGAFAPGASFVFEAFANSIARGVVDALKEVKEEDPLLPFVVELRATTEPGSTLRWRELFPSMQAEVAGLIDNNDLALAAVAFCRLMISRGIEPLQRFHSPALFAEHLAAEHQRHTSIEIAQLIHNTVDVYSQFIDNVK